MRDRIVIGASVDTGHDRTPSPPSDGVLWPGSAAHRRFRRVGSPTCESGAADRPEPPKGDETSFCVLRTCRLDREDRRQEAEDEKHREGDERPGPDG